uniref:Retrotransposable element Tf2 protein type 1 n=1 Tax=Schizaphis graminum TaxID=13262 RepID=A0A2S2PK54_SCHGA
MDSEKVQTVNNFQPPKTKKQIQSFLGYINFYLKFIRDLSQDTEQLSALTKKDTKWVWGTTQQRAFENIKKKFLENIIIQFPDFTKEFYLNTDASTTHVGAELYQINEEGNINHSDLSAEP